MGQERERQSLYDYYYIDNERIASFYAQIYGGLLKEVSIGSTSQEATEVEPKGTAGIFSIRGSHKEFAEESRIETLIPGDVIVEDVVSALLELSKLREFENAKENEFFLVEGAMSILPKELIPMIAEQIVNLLSVMEHKELQMSKSEKRKFERIARESIKAFKSLPWDTLVYVKTTANTVLVGNLKESFIREKVTSLLLKHQGESIPSCYVLGIKESSITSSLPSELANLMSSYVGTLKELLIRENADWITPVAIFRKIR